MTTGRCGTGIAATGGGGGEAQPARKAATPAAMLASKARMRGGLVFICRLLRDKALWADFVEIISEFGACRPAIKVMVCE